MILTLYRCFDVVGAPLITFYLARRRARGKEDLNRFSERLGHAAHPRPLNSLIWLHAASVGESLSLLPLIGRLKADHPKTTLLLTTGTVTSAALMAERLPAGVIHQYVPVDRMVCVRRFLDHWKPNLVLWSESDFWPNFVTETARRNIPLILINGRISPKSFAGWQYFPGFIKSILKSFTLCLGQTDTDTQRLRKLGAPITDCVGNLKFAVESLPVKEADLAALAKTIIPRPNWFAASTHPGEEYILWDVHQRLQSNRPDLLTVIAPRHPTRGDQIASHLRSLGATVAQRSKDEPITTDTQIYLADTMGEMGLFFRLCKLVFMGKSFVDKGGQNPLEAAKLKCTILHGPYMWNFQKMKEQLALCGGAVEVADGATLSKTLSDFFENPGAASEIATKAHDYAQSEARVLDALIIKLSPFLKSVGGDK
ncbi:MAG: 3-deoxy-D-manno-octulosonic acid transferase [Rhodospirillales bacterium]|jgi:3-deoxy-D-manno-octulosonic-acid transferase|tara:strand:+ start:366 stop:1643 length:1278 start_codon:yes stop_codon:yes gene_type:complete